MADDFHADEAFERRVGTVLCGKWTLQRLLGVGGMAAVYEGTHKIGRRVAIKILHPEIARSKDLRARFEQEAHAVNHFKHPGVVEILDVDTTDDGAPFLVMELLEGESLGARAERLGRIGTDEVLAYADQLLEVLAAAHDRGIIHRDVKPDNLFVLNDGRLKLLDFGIARMKEGAPKTMHTRTGATLGTVSYMPPEQVKGLEIDPRADVFAVGATMFRLLARRRIHEARSEAETLVKMATEPSPPLGSVATDVPKEVCRVVDRALSFDRDDRYPDARAMQRDVRAILAGAGGLVPAPAPSVNGARAEPPSSGKAASVVTSKTAGDAADEVGDGSAARVWVVAGVMAAVGVIIGVLAVAWARKGASEIQPSASADPPRAGTAAAGQPTARPRCGPVECDHDCKGNCSIACNHGTCRVEVDSGSEASCTGTGQCSFWCRGDCAVRCAKADACVVYCEPGSRCNIESCATKPRPCKGDVLTCGMPCPR
jgi:serine/threonine-protein kinase